MDLLFWSLIFLGSFNCWNLHSILSKTVSALKKKLHALKGWDYKWASSASSTLTVLYTSGKILSTLGNVKCVQEEDANQSMVCLYTSGFNKWTLQKPPRGIVFIYFWYSCSNQETNLLMLSSQYIFSSVILECLDCCWQEFHLYKKVSALK